MLSISKLCQVTNLKQQVNPPDAGRKWLDGAPVFHRSTSLRDLASDVP